jgi:hypothetical protein
MRKAVLAALVAAAAASSLAADVASPAAHDPNCPMHRAHQAQVDGRHHEATGLPTEATEHHFLLAPDGGSIRLGVKDQRQTETRDKVRAHLRAIAQAFAAGDFALPTRIHGQLPPGADALKARKSALRYSYSDSPEGGVVTIRTADSQALAAVHEFLRFQIRDHGTADPLE